MIVCPLTVSLLAWLLPLVAHTKSKILWHKPMNRQALLSASSADTRFEAFQTDGAFSQCYCEDWFKTMMERTRLYMQSNSLGPDVPYASVWGADHDVTTAGGWSSQTRGDVYENVRCE
jgi:hypothetical protein